jgi:DNA polymerase V
MTVKVTKVFSPDPSTSVERPLFQVPVPAGFPSPADDYIEGKLDLNKHLIKHPAATFFVRVEGDSMIGAGIHSGDLLIVDRSVEPMDKSVVIAVQNGELTVKRIRKRRGKLYLMPDNEDYEAVQIEEGTDFEVWGVVMHVVHSFP